jgi:hypothetical protein
MLTNLIQKISDLNARVINRLNYFSDSFSLLSAANKHGGGILANPIKNIVTYIAALFLVICYGLHSRHSQEESYKKNADAYLIGGEYVTTTNDAGYYLTIARTYKDLGILREPDLFPSSLKKDSTVDLPLTGLLLPITLAKLSNTLEISLEKAGVLLVYISVIFTSILAFGFFSVLRQPSLGLIAAVAGSVSWPIYSRTSIGMVDTDLFNFAFLLSLVFLIACAARAKENKVVLICALLAGFLNFIFYLWYARSGFTVPLLLVTTLYLWANQKPLGIVLISGLLFLLGSGPEQVFGALESLQSFLNNYFFSRSDAVSQTTAKLAHVPIIWNSIIEAIPATESKITGYFGSRWIYVAGVFGLVIWLAQDWRRIPLTLPFIAFCVLFHTSGLRFSMFFAPFIWVGCAVLALAVVHRVITRWPYLNDSLAVRVLVPIFFTLALILNGAAPPKGDIPPPRLYTDEIQELQAALKVRPNPKTVVVSWWDYGSELSYYTGLPTVVNGTSQVGIKSLYLARALIGMDPQYAADELRFATYFTENDLRQSFPNRPSTGLGVGLDYDIYLFIPTNMEKVMPIVHNVAATSLQMSGHDPKRSAFFNLYNQLPNRWGPFELVSDGSSGAAIYRLPAPMSGSRKN